MRKQIFAILFLIIVGFTLSCRETVLEPFELGSHNLNFNFSIDHDSQVTIKITDRYQSLIKRFDLGPLPAGQHTIYWDYRKEDGTVVNEGIYILTVFADGNEAGENYALLINPDF